MPGYPAQTGTNTKKAAFHSSLFYDRVAPYYRQFHYLFIMCLASMLSVACGTAFSRALSISFPVTLQIP